MLIQRLCALLCLLSFASVSIADQQKKPTLQDIKVNLLQAVSYWKQEALDCPDLIERLERVEERLNDPEISAIEIGLYGVLSKHIHLFPHEKQIVLFDNLLSKSSDELLKEAALLIKVRQSAHKGDTPQ